MLIAKLEPTLAHSQMLRLFSAMPAQFGADKQLIFCVFGPRSIQLQRLQ